MVLAPPRAVIGEDGPELFFGLVGAVGTDLQEVISSLEDELRAVRYEPVRVRLSDRIADCPRYVDLAQLAGGPEDERIRRFMDAGDELRRALESGDVVARLAIAWIRNYRRDKIGGEQQPLPRHAYIFDSLKHPAEAELLRLIYGDSLLVVSTYQPLKSRVENLAHKIAKSRDEPTPSVFTRCAEDLAERDANDVDDDRFGQNVRDAFAAADLFVSRTGDVRSQVRRFVRLLFGTPFTTPTTDEYGMFHAKAAALRSADLARQVGAVICTKNGEIIAAGCNEVPKAKGGAYWEGDSPDYRDFKVGYDANVVLRLNAVAEFLKVLTPWLAEERRSQDPKHLAKEALLGGQALLRGTRISGIIEYGRVVHAEMHAIAEAARRGAAVQDAVMYCTTFPCHMCARHVVAAGLRRVVYIEPYPKSLAKELYGRSIRVDDDENADDNAVTFEPFVGLAPKRYFDLFEMRDRRDQDGYAVSHDKIETLPRLRYVDTRYGDLESLYVKELFDRGVSLGIVSA